MQLHIDQRELQSTIDALEFALLVLTTQVEQAQIGGQVASETIEQLQMLRLAIMLGAAKEQRKGRANRQHPVTCNCIDCRTLSRLTTG
jgi:hypothetical protein